jgi:hypothetical protein
MANTASRRLQFDCEGGDAPDDIALRLANVDALVKVIGMSGERGVPAARRGRLAGQSLPRPSAGRRLA